jgi:F-type H+-transporting ATPase subunit b
MFEVNGTLVIFIISFLLFMMALNQILLKPLGEVIEKRNKHIQDDYAVAQGFRNDAEQAVAVYEKHLHEIRSKAQAVINDAVSAAQKTHDTELAKIQQEGREKVIKAKTEIAREKQTLIGLLVPSEIELVKTISDKLLGESALPALEPKVVQHALEQKLEVHA